MKKMIILFFIAVGLPACSTFSTYVSPEVHPSDTALVKPIPKALMQALQADLDIDALTAAAIAGNLAHETGNFTMLQQIRGPSFGYSQWLGSRKTEFFAFAETNGGRHSFEANYGFMIHEIKEGYQDMVSAMRKTQDLAQATRIFMRVFLRPNPEKANFPERLRYARAYLAGEFEGSGCKHALFINGDNIHPCEKKHKLLARIPGSTEALFTTGRDDQRQVP